MASHVWILLIVFHTVAGNDEHGREGFFNKLSNGVKMATDFLASESVALKVAEFVVRAFQTTHNNPFTTFNQRRPPLYDGYTDGKSSEENFSQENKPNFYIDEAQSPMTPLQNLVRLFGLQPNQISAVAVNALVFVAQMISTFLAGPKRPSKPYRSEDPTTWILNKNSRKLQEIIATAKNESLKEAIEDLIKQQSSEETSCIRLFVCKITPFIAKMQKTVFGKDNHDDAKIAKETDGAAAMYRHLPSAEEIQKRSDICEEEHRDCNLNE